jgi:penicillin-binding protein 2
MKTTAEVIAAEARRFHLDKPTSIELPSEAKNMIIPDPEWRRRTRETSWNPGDTANMSIGQGDVLVSPIEMACFAASVARDETFTTPTLVHSTEPRIQHAPSIGLTPIQRATILDGMERCVTEGTAKTPLAMRIPGVRVAGKTGTAQIPGHLNVAWFICFAPLEKPEIAMAIAVEGDTPGENFAGGSYAAPVAMAVLRKYFDKKQHPNPTVDKLAINN